MKSLHFVIFGLVIVIAGCVSVGVVFLENGDSHLSVHEIAVVSFSKVGVVDIVETEGVLDDIVSVRYDDDVDAYVVAGRLLTLPWVVERTDE